MPAAFGYLRSGLTDITGSPIEIKLDLGASGPPLNIIAINHFVVPRDAFLSMLE
ncbi:MAG: hypothetical protein VX236_01310 [Pseudomonadota bacterium]|nr:hypothetical protein [Pseudomonadota bacterium]